LVDHFSGDIIISGASIGRLLAVPTTIHPVIHAFGNQMIRILSWNIQNGKGCDDRVTLSRIVREIEAMGGPDVLCLQEISRGLEIFDNPERPDQMSQLCEFLRGYEGVFGPAIDALGSSGRWQYGNAVFSRLPIVASASHLLPRPGDANKEQMMRQATEIVVDTDHGLRRIITTHLEFHSPRQRLAQILRLRELHEEAVEEQSMPAKVTDQGPYQLVPRPADVVMCGDFNMLPDSDEYQALLAPLSLGCANLSDAWKLVFPDRAHEATCGIHDRSQWSQGPHCRDYFFVAGHCEHQLRQVIVNTETSASDHQPLMIELS
jgi:endonuclease/exonuclease/phosphatase family metal-dependent hydrolase